jgi:hypothetical protein
VPQATTRSSRTSVLLRSFAFGFAFWGAIYIHRMIPQNIIFPHYMLGIFLAVFFGMVLQRNLGDRWLRSDWPWVAALAVAGLSIAWNFNVLFFFLISYWYYPYPPPNYYLLRSILFLSAPLVLMAVYIATGARVSSALSKTSHLKSDLALGALGFGLGNLAANMVIWKSWPAAFAVSMVLLALAVPRTKIARIAAVAIAGLAILVQQTQPDLIYLGSLQEPVLKAKVDSPYARSHFFSYDEGNCITQLGNYHVISFNCKEAEALPRGINYLMRGLLKDRVQSRVLTVGRTLGMYRNALVAADPNIEKTVIAETDLAIAKTVEGKFTDILAEGPPIERHSAEVSRWLLEQQEQYDLVFFNGIGLSQYAIPFTLPYHEQFLFTDRVMKHLFDNILGRHGVLVVDWGGKIKEEQLIFTQNLPPGVKSKVFWYVLTEPPFTGTPLYYTVASRDSGALQRITEHIAQASYFQDITMDPDPRKFGRVTWQRPVMRPEIAGFQTVMLLLLLVGFVLVLWVLQKTVIPPPNSTRPGSVWPARLAGIATIIWFVDVAARQSHQIQGYGYVWPILAAVWFAAVAIGAMAGGRWTNFKPARAALALAAVSTAVLNGLDFEGVPVLVPVVLSGLTAGICCLMVLQQRDSTPGLFGGIAAGYVLYQIAFVIWGFHAPAAIASVCALVAFLTAGRWAQVGAGIGEEANLEAPEEAARE